MWHTLPLYTNNIWLISATEYSTGLKGLRILLQTKHKCHLCNDQSSFNSTVNDQLLKVMRLPFVLQVGSGLFRSTSLQDNERSPVETSSLPYGHSISRCCVCNQFCTELLHLGKTIFWSSKFYFIHSKLGYWIKISLIFADQ